MIKAIIFDCFGVLTVDGWLAFKQHYLQADSQKRQLAEHLNVQADRSEISFETFISQLSDLTGIDATTITEAIGIHPPDLDLLDYIESLKQNYRIGILSNAATDWTHKLFTDGQLQLFDAITLSCNVGVVKPDPKMYETVMGQLATRPDECVYVDDRQVNIDAAQKLGMRGLLYTSFAQFKSDIETVLADAQ